MRLEHAAHSMDAMPRQQMLSARHECSALIDASAESDGFIPIGQRFHDRGVGCRDAVSTYMALHNGRPSPVRAERSTETSMATATLRIFDTLAASRAPAAKSWFKRFLDALVEARMRRAQ